MRYLHRIEKRLEFETCAECMVLCRRHGPGSVHEQKSAKEIESGQAQNDGTFHPARPRVAAQIPVKGETEGLAKISVCLQLRESAKEL